MNVRITSDGTIAGTRTVDTATGKELQLRRIRIEFDVDGGITARLDAAAWRVTAFVESITLIRPRGRANEVGRAPQGQPCPECGGSGEVQLFTSTRPCSRGCEKR